MLLLRLSLLIVSAADVVKNVNGASWSGWGIWSPCTCPSHVRHQTHAAHRSRTRTCMYRYHANDVCPGMSRQTIRCRFITRKKCLREHIAALRKQGPTRGKTVVVEVPSIPLSTNVSTFMIGSMSAGPRLAEIEICGDIYAACESLKSLCSSNVDVKEACKKTCGLCVKPCKDNREKIYCLTVKRLGYCPSVKYRLYLSETCGKTCDLCGYVKPTTKPPGSAEWSAWKQTSCSRTCGSGQRQNWRECVKTGRCLTETSRECQCRGKDVQLKTCNDKECLAEAICADEVALDDCEDYVKRNECNIQFVADSCPLTCGKCTPPIKCGVPMARAQWDNPIVGGRQATKGYWPWQVSIEKTRKGVNRWSFFCGGTLIDTKRVVSAAHCFIGHQRYKYRVTLGEHNRHGVEDSEQRIDVEWVHKHEQYDDNEDYHDIAFVFLSREATFNDYVTPACLPDDGEELKAGKECYITGWGSHTVGGDMSQFLFEVSVPVAKHRRCRDRNTDAISEVTRKMICVGYDDGFTYKSSCHGDSGGPLSCADRETETWKLYGVVSWGDATCDGLRKYSIFSKVSAYRKWIDTF